MEEEGSLWDRFGPQIYGVAVIVRTVAFLVAFLAAVYLLFGIFSGQLAWVDSLPKPDQARVSGVVGVASHALLWGMMLGTLSSIVLYWGEETLGYIILAIAAALGLGLPFALASMNVNVNGQTIRQAVGAFVGASYVPGVFGGLLVVYDVIKRLLTATRDRPVQHHEMSFGADAEYAPKPVRTSIFGKCWEGPYCRDSIRPHCPIFQARQACWRVKRGCFCEEEIVTHAAAKIQGLVLDMAPDPKFNFANPTSPSIGEITGTEYVRHRPAELTMAEKKERCRNCVIYNEHEREKYRFMLPVTILGGIALCLLLSPLLRAGIDGLFGLIERGASLVSFQGGSSLKLSRPPMPVAWAMVAAVTLMVVSKMLQVLEWVCFKAKI